jgi:hypothetical protein
MGGLNK